MASSDPNLNETPQGDASFAPTQWSVVLQAGQVGSAQSEAALARLCQAYWFPLYSYVRRIGHSAEDAQDLTQEFFPRLLEKNYIGAAESEKGKFRSFLLVALKRFLANEWDRANSQKRGGGQRLISLDLEETETRYRAEPADLMTPEVVFQRRWVVTLLGRVLERLENELAADGKGKLFAALKVFLIGEHGDISYAEVAGRVQMTEGALRVTVHRLRQRYRELLRAEIASTVASPDQVDDEIRSLFAAAAG